MSVWLINNCNNMLPNISRSKGNHTIKYGQLIGYNMRIIFLEKSYKKCGGETVPRLFPEKTILRISLDQQSKVLCSLFLLYFKLRAIETDHLHLPCIKLFYKTKRGLELVHLSHILQGFEEKYFSCYILLTDQVILSGCFCFGRYVKYVGQYVNCNCLLTICL